MLEWFVDMNSVHTPMTQLLIHKKVNVTTVLPGVANKGNQVEIMSVKFCKTPSARVPFTRIWMCENYTLSSLLLHVNRIQVYESWANLISVIKACWVLTHSRTFCHLPGISTGRWRGYWLFREICRVGIFLSSSNVLLRSQGTSEAFTCNLSWTAVS